MHAAVKVYYCSVDLQEVECIVCDGQLVFSSCLGGEIRVWDLATAECRLIIDRVK